MLPLRDSIRPRRRAWVTWAIVLVNAAVFVLSLVQDDTTLPAYGGGSAVAVNGFDAITLEYGFTPCELRDECDQPDRGEVFAVGTEVTRDVRVPQEPAWLTVLTSMFMHGSWLHILGNMLFLLVFGPSVEHAMPRLAYLGFYLATGVAADLTQWLTDTSSDVPTIGASGAIAGVLGGYLVLFPRARVLTVLPLTVFLFVREIPAVIVLVFWFGLQVLMGSAALVGPDEPFGVAYFAHVGGFLAGAVLAWPLATRWRAQRRRARAIAAAG